MSLELRKRTYNLGLGVSWEKALREHPPESVIYVVSNYTLKGLIED